MDGWMAVKAVFKMHTTIKNGFETCPLRVLHSCIVVVHAQIMDGPKKARQDQAK